MKELKDLYRPELYEKIRDNGYNYAQIIIPELKKIFDIKSVLDVGCGGASFLRGCLDQGLEVYGVDGNHVESSLQIPRESVEYVNLERPLDLGRDFDLCVSMEVAEHIDNKYSDIFIDSICKHSKQVLFSAAQIGQPGVNHINNQPLEYWIEKFESRGYKHIPEMSDYIRRNLKIYNWYRKNSLVFEAE